MWNGTIFVDLDWPLNVSSLLSASAELLVSLSEHYETLSDYRALSDTSRSHQTSSKSDDPRLRYSDKTIFKMAAVGHLEFSKLAILTTWPVSEIRTTKFSINRTINRWDIAKIRFSIWHGDRPPFWICNIWYFVTWPFLEPKFAYAYEI